MPMFETPQSKSFWMGVLATLVVLGAGAYGFLQFGCMPANADGPVPAFEKWAARKSLRATVQREAPKGEAPIPADEENLLAGVALYKANCMVCHGTSDGEASNVASGLYQKPPQFAVHDVTDDPEGKIYWFIKHGVRMTGMPAYSLSLRDTELWQLALFLKHMDKLPKKAEKVWKALPSARR